MDDKQNLIERLQKGDAKTLQNIYVTYKEEFFLFAKKYQLTNDEVLDIYQDAILALRENAVLGKIAPLTSSLKTYFFSIGKYMIFDFLRQKKRLYVTNDFREESTDDLFDFLFKKELTSQQKKLQKAFQTLGERCKEVLTLFYYRGYTLDEITAHLQYSNKDVVKSQKHRCLQSLKNKMV